MIRETARAAARWLPESVRARLAARRFGYGPAQKPLAVDRRVRSDGVIEVDVDGIRIALTPDAEPDFAFHFIENGDSVDEMAGFLRVSRSAPVDGLLIDVGAHKGLFSLVHLATRMTHRAVLLEPSPPLVEKTRALLALNGMSERADARLSGAGASVECRAVIADGLAFARIVERGAPGAVDVPFTTIDRLCDENGLVPAIIKIDVEGAEADVLRGARHTIRACRPVLCLELHLDALEQAGESLHALVDDLASSGYRFETADGSRLASSRITRSLRAIVRIIAR